MKYILLVISAAILSGSGLCSDIWDTRIKVPENYPTIQEGLDAAVDGDIVLISAGTFTGALNKNLDFRGKSIELMSKHGADYTIIDCEFDGRGILFHSGESELAKVSGLTVKNGDTTEDDYDDYGGAIFSKNYSTPAISHCIFNNNSADYGGGFACRYSSPTLISSSITMNSANYGGGGIYCTDGNLLISECTITKNSAIVGGGLECSGKDTHICLINCMIFENNAESRGGGLASYQYSSVDVIHCVIWNNTAVTEGGGIGIINSTADIVNSILWNNVPDQIYNFLSMIDVSYSNIEGGWEGFHNIDKSPCFISPETGDFHLDISSPCINTAVDAGVETDIEGDPRPIGGGYDMGADEAFLEGPVIFVSPTHLILEGVVGETLSDQVLTIMDVGTEQIEYSVDSECAPWLALSGELSGELNPGDSAFVTFDFDISNLSVGRHIDTLTVFSDDPFRSEIPIIIQLELYSSGLIRMPADFLRVQDAIDYALDGAVIQMDDGIYSGEGNRNIDFWGKEIIIESVNGFEQTIIDCENSGRGFYFHNWEGEKSILRGITIQNGNPDHEVCRVGGGICCYEGSPVISDCFITNCNTTYAGGAIYCIYSGPVISNCIIMGNNAEDDGGGIYFYYFYSGALFNCCFIGNSSGDYGGAVHYQSSTAPIFNCTFYSNRALKKYGGAIFCYESTNTIFNCIFWNDEPDEIKFSCTLTEILFSDIDGGWPGEGNINLDPMFINPDSLDFNLLPESPCIDAGDPSFDVPPEGGSRIDMGAYEYWHGWNILERKAVD